jgi:hypothetical protein
MSFRNHTLMYDVVAPILMGESWAGEPLVRKGAEGWEIRSVGTQTYDEWMPVTFAPTAEVLDEMLSHGEIMLGEDQTAQLVPGPWGLGKDGRTGRSM